MAEQQDRVSSLGDYVAILRRRWQILAVIIPPVLLIAVYTAFSLPAMYRSSATIMLEPSSIPDELVRTTVTSYADQQIELVQRTVMTAERLETVVTDIDPYPELTDYSVHDKAEEIIGNTSLQRVDPVTREPVPESSAFSIFYQNPDPEIAADVTSRIADLFLEYNRETRTAQAREAYDFLLAKSKEVDVQIRALEQQISNFKVQHGDALPESRVRNESSLDRTQRDVDALDSEIRVVEQQESLLKLQLSQISPTITSSGTDVYTQLGQLRAELAAANQKYTPNHPDVKRLTRAIDALAAQANLNTPSTVRPDNPDYLRVQSELQAIQRNLLALRSNVQRARGQMVDYQQRLYQSPTVERDYVQLARDREILQSQFEDIQNKLREAETAQALESQARGERYTLIRSASVPDSPYSPNRLGIILIGIVLGGGLAVGLAAFRESADPTVRNSHDLLEIANVPLIGTIPTLHNDAERRRQRLVWGSVAGVYAVAAIVVTLTVVGANPGS